MASLVNILEAGEERELASEYLDKLRTSHERTPTVKERAREVIERLKVSGNRTAQLVGLVLDADRARFYEGNFAAAVDSFARAREGLENLADEIAREVLAINIEGEETIGQDLANGDGAKALECALRCYTHIEKATPQVKAVLGNYMGRAEHNVSLLLSLSDRPEDRERGYGMAMILKEHAGKLEARSEYLPAWNNWGTAMYAHKGAGEYEKAKECINAMRRLSGLTKDRALLQSTLFFAMGVEAMGFVKEPEKLIAAYREWREVWQQPEVETIERYAASFRELETLKRAMPLVEKYFSDNGLTGAAIEARRIIGIANDKLQRMGKTDKL
mgnify:CR=1 FL=1